jgi:hypothetical protein
MCYYATTDYVCGDWKWGNMKERCPRQHRMGETCGAKLVHHESVTKSDQECKICQEMQIKVRRLRKEQDNVARWRKEGTKFSASIEKAERESGALREQIEEMYSRRPSIAMKMNGQARGLVVQPPAISRTSQPNYPTSGYTAPAQAYGQADRHPDRHSTPSTHVSGSTISSSNRHTSSSATGHLPSPSSNRHGGPYASSRR